MTETAASPADYSLTAKQVADRLGASISTIDNWSRRGRIPFIHTLGRKRRYRPADIDAIAAKMLAGETEPAA